VNPEVHSSKAWREVWCSQTDHVRTRPFRDTRLHRSRISTSTTIFTSRLSIASALRLLAYLAALLYALLLDRFGLSPLPSPRIRTAGSYAPALGLTGSPRRLGTLDHRSRGHLSTPSCYAMDLPDVKDRDSWAIRKRIGFVYKASCTVVYTQQSRPARFPLQISVLPLSVPPIVSDQRPTLQTSTIDLRPSLQITSLPHAAINPSVSVSPSSSSASAHFGHICDTFFAFSSSSPSAPRLSTRIASYTLSHYSYIPYTPPLTARR
jgi:hypothetical protein